MKICGDCGSKNATRALFCSSCGAPFRVADARADGEPLADPFVEEKKRRKRSDRRASPPVSTAPSDIVRRVEKKDDDLNAATARFGASLWSAVVAGFALLGKLFAPIVRFILGAIRDSIVRALSSPSSWDPRRPPNFVYWGLIQFLALRSPTAIPGIVYATMANSARAEEKYDLARERAKRAKNWLLFDFCVGLVLLVFKNLVFKTGL